MMERILRKESDMKKDLSFAIRAGAIQKKQNRFDATMSGMVSSAIDGFAVPWIIKCLKKYTEAEFHTRLAGRYCSTHDMTHMSFPMDPELCMQFSFILDWHLNHKRAYEFFLKNLSWLKRWYAFDIDIIYSNLTDYLTKEWGWKLQEHEKAHIYQSMVQVKNMVYYGNYDGPVTAATK